ncbi:MAG TPA: amidohydrolase family protein [Xanthobacteraceae bacterium]|jgi:predicted TIM-barrel fold metal-dependent hydrolase|nr:amidohydrolase family protein [Xanthobacteraceae bacterium]
MIITDSGVHVWRAAGPDRPWQPGRKAHLETPIGYEKLSAMMAEAGVDRAILVPPSWEGDRVDYALEAAAKYPRRFAVMGRIPVDKPESRQMLETWKDQPGMLGVRLTLHHEWDRPWMTDGTVDWFWPAAERLGIPVMLNAPTLQAEIAAVASRHPGLRLILDHMGRVRGMKDETLLPSIEQTLTLASHPNVFVKLTQIPECSSPPYPYRSTQPYVRRIIEAFGPRRSFWGTDLSAMLSRTGCTYRQAVTLFTEEMKFLSPDDITWIMGRGIAECLPWPTE